MRDRDSLLVRCDLQIFCTNFKYTGKIRKVFVSGEYYKDLDVTVITYCATVLSLFLLLLELLFTLLLIELY